MLILESRLEHALELIKNTDLSFSEIAFESGFKDPSYFTKQIKTFTGQTPKELRKYAVIQR